jgi:hypothetical protein
MVEGQDSDLYASDIDTWSITSTVQGSDEESPVDSHSPSGSCSNNVALVIDCLMIDVCVSACLVGVVGCLVPCP